MQDLQIPFFVVDSAIIIGLHLYDKQLKKGTPKNEKRAEEVQVEANKKEARAQKTADRAQRKAQDKMTKLQNGSKQASFAPKQTIKQPEGNKKSR